MFVFLGSANGIVGLDLSTAHAFIQSTESGAEFGSSVAGAGDINLDVFDDIIAGAPLTGPSGLAVSGAAYIFMMNLQASQPPVRQMQMQCLDRSKLKATSF